jgi:4-hydroxybutyrate CoA-transferase
MGATPYAAPSLDRHLRLHTFFPGKGLRDALKNGRVESIRVPLSTIPRMFKENSIKADVLMLQVSPPDQDGRVSLGISVDYMRAVLAQNPIVIAEINTAMPRTCGNSLIDAKQLDYIVDARTPPQFLTSDAAGVDSVDQRIADNVAELIGHESIIQVGIGSISDLVLGNLSHLRDLGIHSGIITDAVVPLIERGVVTNVTKRKFVGKSVTTMAAGTPSFYEFLHNNKLVEFHPCDVTHDAEVLASIDGLCAINSVLQIDLAGRANSEQVNGRAISSVGGLPDFARGASCAKGGLSIITLRSTSRDGSISNVLTSLPLGVPSTIEARDIDFVVTEYGAANIRGLSPTARALALTGVAHPEHRAALQHLRELHYS